MNDSYVIWEMTNWEDALKLANALPENWIFRGQSNAAWSLSSSLERYPRAASRSGLWVRRDAERQMLESFKRHGHLVIDNLPSAMDNLDWLSLLQHHGGVTRLLDFTESFYVGTFFAVESAVSDAAVWAVDRRYLRQNFRKKINEWDDPDRTLHTAYEQHEADLDVLDQVARELANRLIGGAGEFIGAVVVTPYHMNERLSVQQGLFLFPLGLSEGIEFHTCQSLGLPEGRLPDKAVKSLNDILGLLLQNKPVLLKIQIPVAQRFKILHDLRRMNITAASIYPGLDGFARSLNYYATGYRAIDHQGGGT